MCFKWFVASLSESLAGSVIYVQVLRGLRVYLSGLCGVFMVVRCVCSQWSMCLFPVVHVFAPSDPCACSQWSMC